MIGSQDRHRVCVRPRHVILPRDLNFFFFNDTATTEIYTLSLHDALPISSETQGQTQVHSTAENSHRSPPDCSRSEEHTSELQSPCNLVCRLLLEKKKTAEFTPMAPLRLISA